MGEQFFVYDPRTNAWTELAPSPIDSENNAGATYLNGNIYTAYTENSEIIGVYNIALNSWASLPNPLKRGTGDITSGNGLLYMAVAREFVAYDPATNIVTPLAEPPELSACDNGFEDGVAFSSTVA